MSLTKFCLHDLLFVDFDKYAPKCLTAKDISYFYGFYRFGFTGI